MRAHLAQGGSSAITTLTAIAVAIAQEETAEDAARHSPVILPGLTAPRVVVAAAVSSNYPPLPDDGPLPACSGQVDGEGRPGVGVSFKATFDIGVVGLVRSTCSGLKPFPRFALKTPCCDQHERGLGLCFTLCSKL